MLDRTIFTSRQLLKVLEIGYSEGFLRQDSFPGDQDCTAKAEERKKAKATLHTLGQGFPTVDLVVCHLKLAYLQYLVFPQASESACILLMLPLTSQFSVGASSNGRVLSELVELLAFGHGTVKRNRTSLAHRAV